MIETSPSKVALDHRAVGCVDRCHTNTTAQNRFLGPRRAVKRQETAKNLEN
ncbi:MAG: hypothetical protein JOZ09_17530 [Pseudonocardiales bacterium]|jgi:hypothetical protein|nr:hypothetical protein [Pseudonocardiales bacterium]